MNEEILVSVLVPAYNVEKYIGKCIESILKQTHHNIEVVIVDDGSTDQTGNICDDWSKKDCRITVIHSKNGGLACARNVALPYSKGKYISFVDSDDCIRENFIEALLSVAEKEGSDIVACGVDTVNEDGFVIKEGTKSGEVVFYDTDGAFTNIDKVKFECWNKIYRKEVIGNFRFKEGQRHENIYFQHTVFFKAQKIAYVDLPLYRYLVERKGATLSQFNMGRLSVLEEYPSLIYDLKIENMIKGVSVITNFALKHLIQTYWAMCKFEVIEKRNEVVKLIRRLMWENGKYLKCTKKEKITYAIFFLSPRLTYMIHRLHRGE